jgi:hypothetical protein
MLTHVGACRSHARTQQQTAEDSRRHARAAHPFRFYCSVYLLYWCSVYLLCWIHVGTHAPHIHSGFTAQFTCFTGTKVQLLTLLPHITVVRSLFLAAGTGLYLLYWYKSTITDAAGTRHARLGAGDRLYVGLSRYSFYLLYWYKSATTDACWVLVMDYIICGAITVLGLLALLVQKCNY